MAGTVFKTSLLTLTASSNYGTVTQVDTDYFETENTFEFLLASDNNDLIVIKKADTGTNTSEIHIVSANSSYNSYSLQIGSGLHETDVAWSFGLDAARNLFAIKRANLANSDTELHVLSKDSGYSKFSVQQTLKSLSLTDNTWQYLVAGNGDLYCVKKQKTGTNSTEIHMLTAASGYQSFGSHNGTCIPESDMDVDFFGLDSKNNVYAIKRTAASPELIILNSATGPNGLPYSTSQTYTLPLPKADHRYAFVLAQKGDTCDVYAILKSSTLTGYVEIKVVTAVSKYAEISEVDYQSPLPITDGLYEFTWTVDKADPEKLHDLCIVKKNHTTRKIDNELGNVEVLFLREPTKWQLGDRFVTSWPKSDESCNFMLAYSRDLVVVKKSGNASKKTEVDVLSWTSGFKNSYYPQPLPTWLDETDGSWTFLLADNLDIIAIHKSNTASKKTEYMELLSATDYKEFAVSYPTCLDETDDSWDFLLAPNRDVYAIQKYGTTSGKTEITILQAARKWTEIEATYTTALPPTDYNYSFCLTDQLDVIAIQKSRFPFSSNMACR